MKGIYNHYEGISKPSCKKSGVNKGREASYMKTIGDLLDEFEVQNPRSLQIFSSDELESNKINEVFKYTSRNFQSN